MRTLIVILVCAGFLFAGAPDGFAVEKKGKDKSTGTHVKVTPAPKPTPKKPSAKSKDTRASNTKKFDTFIDRNHNGVDDRHENLKRKVKSQAAGKKPDDKK